MSLVLDGPRARTKLLEDDPVDKVAAWMWQTVPLRVSRRFPILDGVVGDGHWLTANPVLAVFMPIACLVAGVAAGALGSGYELLVTESMFLMTTVLALGALSGQLALLSLSGFVVGDFFVRTPILNVPSNDPLGLVDTPTVSVLDIGILQTLLQHRLPLVIVYLVLAAGIILVPRVARNIAALVLHTWRVSDRHAWLVASCAYVVTIWLAITGWAAALPVLTRPVFGWWIPMTNEMGTLTPAAVYPLTLRRELVAAAVVGAIIRQLVVLLIRQTPSALARVEIVERLAPPVPPPAELTRWQQFWRCVVGATLGTLVMAGLVDGLWTWIATGGVFLLLGLIRARLWRPAWSLRWNVRIARLPLITRILLIAVGSSVLGTILAGPVLHSYQDLTLFILGGAIAGALLLMPPPDELAIAAWRERRPGRLAASPTLRTSAGVCVAVVGGCILALLLADPASAAAISKCWLLPNGERIAVPAVASIAAQFQIFLGRLNPSQLAQLGLGRTAEGGLRALPPPPTRADMRFEKTKWPEELRPIPRSQQRAYAEERRELNPLLLENASRQQVTDGGIPKSGWGRFVAMVGAILKQATSQPVG